ncbi:PAS domain S-box-containing protein [Seinonella peptonophila]|uniref:PAS domain S-box-containing protein n=1 Tax=Seinonella peptonophila TaxID=112248 RepID=A0A1M4SMH6_9BACL|nr:sigma 54-interacting transcriptional regulator [Seinonella peptonophila]SHE33358.1 PAS domain S-box-containing protein [Seinonella peptonophila]
MERQDHWLLQELEAIFHTSYQSIFVTDRHGKVLRVSESVAHTCGLAPEELIGENVYDLERRKIFYPSVTRSVLESGKKESIVQHTRSGNTLLVEAIPIRSESGEIIRIIAISKDISEINHLQKQLAELTNLMEGYQKELLRLKQETLEETTFIVKSKAMIKVTELMHTVAYSDASVLILGETGVGKQVVATHIHQWSDRKEKPFITINCGAIPENLLETELFGYESGAFSGAKKGGKLGIFELANGGTVFLDEISELPLHLQVKLLRVLQERKVMRVGGAKEHDVDIRVLTATNQNLEEMVQRKKFRQDLYYRIHVIPMLIPPLRERKEDIYDLTIHFLERFNQKYNKKRFLSEHQLQLLLRYQWPGNVRELENTVERFVVTGQIFDSLLEDEQLPSVEHYETKRNTNPLHLPTVLKNVERDLLLQAKRECRTTREMADYLGIHQSTVVRKLQSHDLID